SQELLQSLAMPERFPSHREYGRRQRPALAEAKSARGWAPAGHGSPAIRSTCPETICGKRQPPEADHAGAAALTARAVRDCVRAFCRNRCPDQTQSPWDQYLNLWRAHIVVEKIPKFLQRHLCNAAGSAWCREFLACA